MVDPPDLIQTVADTEVRLDWVLDFGGRSDQGGVERVSPGIKGNLFGVLTGIYHI